MSVDDKIDDKILTSDDIVRIQRWEKYYDVYVGSNETDKKLIRKLQKVNVALLGITPKKGLTQELKA